MLKNGHYIRSKSQAEKFGYKTKLKVNHPFENKQIPVFVANFVLMDYGTGAILVSC